LRQQSLDSSQSKFNSQFGFLDEDEIFFSLINEKSRKSKTEYKGRSSFGAEQPAVKHEHDHEVIEEQSIEETQDKESLQQESLNETEETNNFFKQLELKQHHSTFHRDRRQNRLLERK
jgi:hypothetical protein